MESGEQVHGRDAVPELIVGLQTQLFDGYPEVTGLDCVDGRDCLEAVSWAAALGGSVTLQRLARRSACRTA